MTIRSISIALLIALSVFGTAVAGPESQKIAINPSHLPETTQYGFSQANSVSASATVIYISGQIGVSEDGPNDFESQVDRSFDNLIAVIEATGGKVEDVVKITLLIKNHDDKKLQYLVSKRRSVFGKNPPASTLIPVPVLALESLEFEIDAILVTQHQLKAPR